MLGTVKMEGHESSDWNSYYADTQEVRGGNQVGHWEPVPGEAARGGRWARWAADGLGAPPQCPRCAPTRCGPGRALTGPRSGSAAPRGRPSLGAGVERAKGVQEILAFESTRSRKHLPLPYGEPEPGSGCRGLAGGRAGDGTSWRLLWKTRVCLQGRPLYPAVEFKTSEESGWSLS